MSTSVVILFDIDGTLIRCGGAGGQALCTALEEEFSVVDVQPVALHGRTDLGIANELLQRHGLETTEQNRERLFGRYFHLLPYFLQQKQSLNQAVVLPGVQQLLEWADSHSSVVSALMTGNMPASARIKLQHFSLWDYFEFGVFGDLADHRPLLAGPAMTTIQAHLGFPVDRDSIVVVGDTPLDVELARTMGARCLAVTTGGFSESELLDAGADQVLSDLNDISRIQDWLLDSR